MTTTRQVPERIAESSKFRIRRSPNSLELFGRHDEVAVLKSCFHRMMKTNSNINVSFHSKVEANSFFTSDTHKELVFIRGLSGTGKSSLSRCIQPDVEASENGLFVEGKFDIMTSNQPYTGVAKAFGTICRHVQASKEESIAAVGRMISNELQDEVHTLLPLIPELKGIINTHSTPRRQAARDHGKPSLENGQDRWKYAFRLLSRALNAAFSPLVVVLDDLHWSDISSLHVIDYLISDLQNPNKLMIIGCYRSEEVMDRGILLSSIEWLEQRQGPYAYNMTEIELDGCQVDHVNKMIMSIISIDDENETQELAEICYRRTVGNPFFIQQFMTMLENDGLIKYDDNSSKWTWNLYQIETQTKYTSTVVDLLQGRMKKLPEEVQLLVQFAACLGTSFTLSTIGIIWKQHGADSFTRNSDLSSLLKILQNDQFIEEYEDKSYRFVHDKIQEAAISLTENVNASFKFKIGKTLLSALDEEHLEDELFDVVDLINRGNVATRPELAALNLRAADKAYSQSAFQSAATYVEYGAALLPRDHWRSHRDLTLDLFTRGAETEIALGNSSAAAGYCNAVLQHEDCTVMEKLPIHFAIISRLSGGDAKLKRKALDMTLGVLKELGYPLVKSKAMISAQTVVTLVQTVRVTKKRLEAGTLDASLDAMTEPQHDAVMHLLQRVATLSYHLEIIFLNALANCQLVNMTLKYGKHDLSAQGIASIGILCRFVLKEDLQTAVSCVESALSIQKSVGKQNEGWTMWSCYVFCLCWCQNLESFTPRLEYAYQSALQFGKSENAMWILGTTITVKYAMGKSLNGLLEELARAILIMEEHQQMEQAKLEKLKWRTIMNMTTGSSKVTDFQGSEYDSKEPTRKAAAAVGDAHFLEGELLIVSSFEAAAERAIKHGDKFQKLCLGLVWNTVEMFHRGVALYAMARKHNQRKYRARAAKIRKQIKKWWEEGNPNVEHYDLLLDAEHAALNSKRYDMANNFYKRAIGSACRLGHLHHSALCNERYADFLLHVRKDKTASLYRLSEAIRFYEEWGAMGKVNELKRQMI